ncbi:hypothetical protein [Sorangium cellulosum]|uniref:hypothetical protein n=1 Tax=Sorangium cellulosum TaxID=56 RepID=UPI0007C4D483|nr:hypothetical protein [Sorangium cellulosum]
MRVVNTASIPAIESLKADERTLLGLFRDIRKHEELSAFLPEACRLSLRWVRLAPGQPIRPRQLPGKGMIVITDGSGEVIGGSVRRVQAGDAVLVPPGGLQGLMGGAPDGLSAISIHFEGEDARWDTPCLCATAAPGGAPSDRSESPLDRLVEENEAHAREFAGSPLMQLIRSERALGDDVKRRMLGALQIWSNAFQKVLCARVVFESHPAAIKIAERHLAEEVGHNRRLARMHGPSSSPSWDRGIAAASSWFIERMGSASTEERTVLIHFVIERCADILLSAAQQVFPDSDYFATHAEVDAEHFRLGYELLKSLPGLDIAPLRGALIEGWQMMNLICQRISDIAELGCGAAAELPAPDVVAGDIPRGRAALSMAPAAE